MNIAKKTKASANCRYGEPPVTVKKKVPSNATAPTTAHTVVTTLEVRLANMRASPFVWWVMRRLCALPRAVSIIDLTDSQIVRLDRSIWPNPPQLSYSRLDDLFTEVCRRKILRTSP